MNAHSSSSSSPRSPRSDEPVPSSDVFEIADACIERVREVAGLGEVDVLPPLPRVSPRREVVMLLKSDVADGSAHGPSAVPARRPREVITHSTKRPTGSGWALVLCAMFAVGSAGASFLSSPLGHKPSVVRVTEAARAHARQAAHATAALLAGP